VCSANPRLHRLTLQLTVYVFNRLVTKLFKRHNYEDVQKFGIRLQGTIPYHSGQVFYRIALRPSVGPSNAHPRINPKVTETFYRFLQTSEEYSSVLVLGHLVIGNTFQRIHIVSWRWHNSCLKDAGSSILLTLARYLFDKFV